MTIKLNDLVTIETSEYSSTSNTLQVIRKLESECLLAHPNVPELLLLKKDQELNSVQAILPNEFEKALFWAKKHMELLSYTAKADLQAMIYYFIVSRNFTPKQRAELLSHCGKIASVILHNNINLACSKILSDQALLEDYYKALFNEIKSVIENPSSLKSKRERFTIFNLAGFIMAQSSTEEK